MPAALFYVLMSALGQKQTCATHKSMSALCQKQGLLHCNINDEKEKPPRDGPKSSHGRNATACGHARRQQADKG